MKPHHVLLITALSPLLILAARARSLARPSTSGHPRRITDGHSRNLQQPYKRCCVWTAG